MEREPIVFVGTSDLSAHFRGKSFAAAELPSRLQRGVGLSPTNLFLSAFGPIQVTPFGTAGEVALIPDPTTRVQIAFDEGPGEFFFLGDLRTLQGAPWEFCPREVLRRALEQLNLETGFRVLAAFEQELTYSGVPTHPPQPYELEAYRRQGKFGEMLLAAMRQSGITPDTFLSEYGPRQYEVTSAPRLGVRAADDAVITREVAHAVAFRLGERVSFAPIHDPNGVGNGTHIHFSFEDGEGRPVLYDESRPWQLSKTGCQFVAGILHHLPSLCAITAASVASYYRLRPNRWAPVKTDVGHLDRGASIRIAPVFGADAADRARQFNIEFRVADATANPYLALAVLIQAGLDGVRRGREIETIKPLALPTSLTEALKLLEANDSASEWLGKELLSGYLLFKKAEAEGLRELDEGEVCRRYSEVY